VRYLGSTIVLQDEACYCQFDGPSEAAVAVANRKAGLSFDRIVPAVGIKTDERSSTMSVHTTIAAPPRQWRTWLLIGAAALAVGAIAAALVLAIGGTGTKSTASSSPVMVNPPSMVPQVGAFTSVTPAPTVVSGPTAPSIVPQVSALISVLTPAQLANGALGLGYALPSAQHGPTIASVLNSMTPETRRYTKAIMSLTFAQLAAGAAGSP